MRSGDFTGRPGLKPKKTASTMGQGAAQHDGTTAQAAPDGLLRGRPGEVGVDPHAIADFLDDVADTGLDLHSLMVHR